MKKGLLFILLAAASVCLPAQEKENAAKSYTVETNRFGANWFISGGIGAQMYFGDNDGKADFGKRLAPALDIAVGKWFTPGIGLRLAFKLREQLLLLTLCMQKVVHILTDITNRNGIWLISMVMFCSTFLTCCADTMKIVFIHLFLM